VAAVILAASARGARRERVVTTSCPGEVEWSTGSWYTVKRVAFGPSGGVMPDPSRHAVTLRPALAGMLTFGFRCGPACGTADAACCGGKRFAIEVSEA
jgi:hypothetical protein